MNKDYTLLIIDDEPLARFSFKKMIETRFPGFVVSGEAGTGPEGLELYRRLKPDIVMMDIQIPDLNGLETSRLILEGDSHAQIIVLSAYDQFDYVQEAINHGVLGYLLKPVHEKKLETLLRQAVERIEHREESLKDKVQLETFRDIAEGDMITSFIYGSCGGLDASFYASRLEFPVTEGYFSLFRLDRQKELKAETSLEINEYIRRLPGCYPGRWIGDTLPVFVRVDKDARVDDLLVNGIAHRIQVLTGSDVHKGTGALQDSPEKFHLSYKQALEFLETGSYGTKRSEFRYFRDLETRFLEALKDNRQIHPDEILDRIFTQLSSPDLSLKDCQLALTEFLIQFRRDLEDRGEGQGSRLIGNLIRDIPLHRERLELLSWLAHSILDYLEIHKSIDSVEDLQIRKILKYIDLNDFREISLETAAVSVGLTPQYLSRIFKDRYKMNFLEYLISRRISLACRLLTDTDLTVREIAEKAGYSDVNYFGKVFKKQKGMSPRDYRLKS